MEPEIIGLIGTAVFIILVLIGVWIGFAALTVGIVGIAILKGWGTAGGVTGFLPYTVTASFALSVIPMFIIMGYFAYHGGVTRALFTTARQWFGHLPGGLAIATVFGSAGFGACCGSSNAAAAVMGKVAIPEMLRYDYDPKLAAGAAASAGTLAVMIPPSVNMVIYGVLTEQSVGKLFIAGIFPGIIEATLYAIMVYFWCRLKPGIGAALPAAAWKQRFASLKGSGGMLIIGAIVMGGIYGGVFTPTEAGGIAAISALGIAMASRHLNWDNFKQSLLDTGKTTAMIFLTLVGVLILLRFLALSGTVRLFISSLIGLPLPPLGTLIVIIFIYLILGMFVSVIGMLMLTLDVFFPIIMALGYDPIWFGILVVSVSEIAFITPPVAMNVYAVKAVAPEIPTEDIMKGVLPFLANSLLFVVILVAFPQIATWLPGTMKGG